ncbi:MAG: choice-of-anchor L domain-containing protein [Pseudomonadota bacterium]
MAISIANSNNETLLNALIGDAFLINSISNINFIGDATEGMVLADGYTFEQTVGGETVSINEGIFLTSGTFPGEVNDRPDFSDINGTPGDAELDAAASAAFAAAGSTEDAMVLEFTITQSPGATYSGISFDLIFGSEEYPEFADSDFVDIAVVSVNGTNYALFNGQPDQPLSVIGTNVTTENNFIDNTSGAWATQYDGFSERLTIFVPLALGQNNVRIGIADTGDDIYDSGLFIGNVRAVDTLGSGTFVTGDGGTSGSDDVVGTASPETFKLGFGDDTINPGLGTDILSLGAGADLVIGAPTDLDGDVISDFTDADALELTGVTLSMDDIEITLGSAILDIDTDGDSTADTTITLQGAFEVDDFMLDIEAGNTVITTEGAATGFEQDGTEGADVLLGSSGNNRLNGLNGADRINGLEGDDVIFGGSGESDLSDTVFGGDGNDTVDGGAGNDVIFGGDGDDVLAGGFGVDQVQGQGGNDTITGSAFSDLVFGGDGDDFVNGGFGSDRVNGGNGADRFFHIGAESHGSDWLQDYDSSEGDALVYGGARARSDFQVNFANTAGAGDVGTAEAFIVDRTTGQILWALVDGADQDQINLRIAGVEYDLLA